VYPTKSYQEVKRDVVATLPQCNAGLWLARL